MSPNPCDSMLDKSPSPARHTLMHTMRRLVGSALLCIAIPALAATVKDRAGAVRDDKAAMQGNARWIYNDVQKGFLEAKWRNKPILVVLRCVPCLSCAGIDATVLQEPGLAPLLDRFVCVRVINANALDLSLFQFDYDLSFSTLFFNADGTVYGRYGSWKHQKDPRDKTFDGYKHALEAALAIHADYPKNKAALAGKQGGPMPFKTPLEIPGLAGKYKTTLDWEGKVVGSCVHCHQIGDAIRTSLREQKKTIPGQWIYPQPAPESVGLTLAPDAIARVTSVQDGSPAHRAGIAAGDDLVSVAGQPLISVADMSWALHRAADSGPLPIVVKREGTVKALELTLPSGWRETADISRRVGTWTMRAMALGGLVLEDVPDEQRKQSSLATDRMALRVKFVGQYGIHAAAKRAGFQKDDIIVEFAGKTDRLTESAAIGKLLRNHPKGERVSAEVLRGTERVRLTLPMQ
jgi:serine protease Do